MLGFCAISNAVMAYYGPGECIPILPKVITFAHTLTSFSFVNTKHVNDYNVHVHLEHGDGFNVASTV